MKGRFSRFINVLYLLLHIPLIVLFISPFTDGGPLGYQKYFSIKDYNVICNSNNKPVVLQGSETPVVEKGENLPLRTWLDERYRFYCGNYDRIETINNTYLNAKTFSEKQSIQLYFNDFKENAFRPAYKNYNLKLIKTYRDYEGLWMAFKWHITSLIMYFVVLQTFRMIYLYIYYGEIVWHPYRLPKGSK